MSSGVPSEVAWCLFALLALAIVLASLVFVRTFADTRDSHPTTNRASALSFALVLLAGFLIPVDIYLASSTHGSDGKLSVSGDEIESREDAVSMVYYILHALILLMGCVAIPYAYFYYEEDDVGMTHKMRMKASLKYTFFLFAFVVLLVTVGALVELKDPPKYKLEWVKNIYSSKDDVGSPIIFATSILAIMGAFCLATYTVYGMNAIVVLFVRGNKVPYNIPSLRDELEINREKQRVITDKYQYSTNRKLSSEDKEKYSKLQREERIIIQRMSQLEKPSCINECFKCFSPFFIVLGIIIFCFNTLLIVSIEITSFDRLFNSICGAECGFLLNKPTIVNPTDEMLVLLSEYFPLDYIVTGFIVVYFFLATFVGIYKSGIRLFWFLLFKLKVKKSVPQAILLTTITLMLTMLGFNILFPTLAPQYATFGAQSFLDETSKRQCDLETTSDCVMTQLSRYVNQILLRSSFFSGFFISANFFMGFWYFVTIFMAFKQEPVSFDEDDEDEDDESSDLLGVRPKTGYSSSANAERIREKYFGQRG